MFHFIYVQVSPCVFPSYGQGMYCMPSSRTCHRGCTVCHHPVPVTGDVLYCHHPVPVTGDVLYAIIPYLSYVPVWSGQSQSSHVVPSPDSGQGLSRF